MEQVVTEWFCPSDAFRAPVVPPCALTLTNSEFRRVPEAESPKMNQKGHVLRLDFLHILYYSA